MSVFAASDWENLDDISLVLLEKLMDGTGGFVLMLWGVGSCRRLRDNSSWVWFAAQVSAREPRLGAQSEELRAQALGSVLGYRPWLFNLLTV